MTGTDSTIHIRHASEATPRGMETDNTELRSPAVDVAVAEVCSACANRDDYRGADVVVKPNVFMPYAPATTDPRVVAGVVAWLLDAGAARVRVAEESSISTHVGRKSDTYGALEQTGYVALVESFDDPRVSLALFREDGTVRRAADTRLSLQEIAEYPKLLAEAERLISVPILKFHLQTLLTNAVKNTWSGTPQLQRAANHCWGLAGALLDTHYIRPPDFTVVDALQPLTGDHSYGDPLDWRLVMAGVDSIALDALGAWMLGFDDPLEVETVRLGAKAGLGMGDLERIKVEGIARADLPRADRPGVPTLPAEFGTLDIQWQCGPEVGPGCLAYLTAGLRSLAERDPGDLGTWQIFVGEDPDEPEELADRCLFVGVCSMEGETYRNVQRRLYLAGRADDLICVAACPPMALRTEIMRLVGLD